MARAKRAPQQAEVDKKLEAALEQLRKLGAVDLTQRVTGGQLPAAHGRERELERVLATLAERRSLLLVGPTGVGKSAIIHEAAARVAQKRAPTSLDGTHFVQVSTTALEAGSINTGAWSGRLQQMVEAVKSTDGRIIVYIENIWNLPEAGRYAGTRESFSTFLRSYIEDRSLVLIGESTPDNLSHSGAMERFRGFALTDDPVLASLETIPIEEPDLPAIRDIVQIVAFELEESIHVRIDPVVVERVIELARRFQPYEAFPGKAIRLLHQVAHGARANAAQPDSSESIAISPTVVTESFARQTGLPERLFSDSVALTTGDVDTYFSERVVGQDEAVGTLVDLITLIKAELTDPRRPLGVLLFVGPTGSGKTFLAKTMAEFLFGTESKLIRFDMSEFQSPSSVYYLQRQLTDRVRQQRFAVVLLDEVEKAAMNIFDLFLQAFDDARLTDPDGQTLDLKNVVFVMTSNLGGGALAPRTLGFSSDGTPSEAVAEDVARRMRAVQETFRPEFINRLDKIVSFRPLDRDAMRRIARRELGRALEREGVRRRNILMDFGEDVLDLLLDAGFSEEFGARPLQRSIKEIVLVPLARRIAANPSATDQLLQLRTEDGRLVIDVIPLQPRGEVEGRLAAPETPEEQPKQTPGFNRLAKQVSDLQASIAAQIESSRFKKVEERSAVLLRELARPSFWDDADHARTVNSAIYQLSRVVERLTDLRRRVDALAEVPALLTRHHRTADLRELDRLEQRLEHVTNEFGLVRLELVAASAADPHDLATLGAVGCCISISPASAAGARAASDWPETLARMYLGWARNRGYDADAEYVADSDRHEVRIQGPGVAEILRGEAGVHKRQTTVDGRRRPAVDLALVTLELDASSAQPPPAVDRSRIIRLYHLAGAADVRDPRTGHRSAHPRDVLAGRIDGFLIAYLESAT